LSALRHLPSTIWFSPLRPGYRRGLLLLPVYNKSITVLV